MLDLMTDRSRRLGGFIGFLAVIAFAPTTATAASLVETYKDWTMFKHDDPSKKLCFIATQPKSSTPQDTSRDSPFFYVTHWPGEGVKSEVSVLLGHKSTSSGDVTVKVGNQSFDLFIENGYAFLADPTAELKLIDAMKRGNTMSVVSTSASGKPTTDNYSLSGVTKAVGALTSNCN